MGLKHNPDFQKKCSKTKIENYRPISLTRTVGRVLGSKIKDIIVEHIEDNNLLNDRQWPY